MITTLDRQLSIKNYKTIHYIDFNLLFTVFDVIEIINYFYLYWRCTEIYKIVFKIMTNNDYNYQK